MKTVIQLLEQLGANAQLQSAEMIPATVAKADIDTELASAIINKDVTSLERQLDVCPDIVCIMIEPDELPTDSPERKEPEKKEQEEDKDNQALSHVANW